MFEGVADVRWMDAGACMRLEDASIMFPRGRVSPAARETCAGCPVLNRCREWTDQVEATALQRDFCAGILAGETPQERVARRALVALEAAASVADTAQGAAFLAGTDNLIAAVI